MEQTIFGKPFSDITYQDVVDFCSLKKKEGINLDYKRNLSSPKPLIKTIAAFANTRDGYIIIGVEDEDDKPKLPVTGIDYVESLSLTVTNIFVDNLYPYFAPQIQVCEPVNNKTFIIIHVPESPEAPHWLFNRRELYIRREDRSTSGNWERFATEQEWEFLRNKRQKSLDLRRYSLEQMDQIFIKENLDDLRSRQPPIPADQLKVQWAGLLRIKLMPLFPSTPVADVKRLEDLLMAESVNNIHSGTFPHPSEKKVFQSGAYQYVSRRSETDYGVSNFTAINTFGGLVAYERILLQRSAGPSIFASHVVELVEACMRYMSNIYGQLGYHGNVGVEIEFKGPENVLLELPPQFSQREPIVNILGRIDYYEELETSSLGNEDDRYNLLVDLIKELLYSFGRTMNPNNVVDQILSDTNQYHEFIAGRQSN